MWCSPSVFYIPIMQDKLKADIIIISNNKCKLKFGQEQFYALDLEVLKEITEVLKNNKAEIINIKNGKADFVVNADEKENLYISIPYDKNWEILQNGKKINPNLFADCMYSIKLIKGINTISMEYKFNCLRV